VDSVALLPSPPCRLQGVLSIEPQNVRATSNLALIYLDLRNLEKSEEMFLRTLQIDPTYRSSIYNLGVLYNHQQRYGTFAWTPGSPLMHNNQYAPYTAVYLVCVHCCILVSFYTSLASFLDSPPAR